MTPLMKSNWGVTCFGDFGWASDSGFSLFGQRNNSSEHSGNIQVMLNKYQTALRARLPPSYPWTAWSAVISEFMGVPSRLGVSSADGLWAAVTFSEMRSVSVDVLVFLMKSVWFGKYEWLWDPSSSGSDITLPAFIWVVSTCFFPKYCDIQRMSLAASANFCCFLVSLLLGLLREEVMLVLALMGDESTGVVSLLFIFSVFPVPTSSSSQMGSPGVLSVASVSFWEFFRRSPAVWNRLDEPRNPAPTRFLFSYNVMKKMTTIYQFSAFTVDRTALNFHFYNYVSLSNWIPVTNISTAIYYFKCCQMCKISAVKWLIAINNIQNYVFVYIICSISQKIYNRIFTKMWGVYSLL